jgi:hypothetical protein
VLERLIEQPLITDSIVTRCSIVDALQYLMQNAYCFSLNDKTEKKTLLNHYLDLVKNVPVYRVLLTPGLDNLEKKLDQIEKAF